MTRLLDKVVRSVRRDRGLPLLTIVRKGRRYLAGSALAPHRLRDCDRIGTRVRTLGRPRVENGGRITIGDDVVLNSEFAPCELLTGSTGRIEIGSGVAVNFGTSIAAGASVRIGDRVSIGPYCIIADSEWADGSAEGAQPIEIGEGVWLAGRVTVMPGTRIGAGSVITAGSIVTGDIPPGVVAGGIPARVLRRIENAPPGDVPSGPATADQRTTSEPSSGPARGAVGGTHLPALHGVILSDFTTGDLAVRLRDAADQPVMEVVETPYGQVIPPLLASPPEGATDFCVVWTRPEAVSDVFQRVVRHEPVSEAEIVRDVDAFCDAVEHGAHAFRFVFVATWVTAAAQRGLGMIDTRPGGISWALSLMNQRLMARFASAGNIYVLDAQRWLGASGPSGSSAKAWYLGKIAFAGEVTAEAARDIKGAVRGLLGQARKLLVLDLDDTLWGGIVGDTGWENLQLGGHDPAGEAFVDFQHAIKRLTRRGVVLGIVSKNTESVALEAIRNHPEMVLRLEDFVGWRINWQDKARNVAELAAELNLGLQSVVFIDDNPVERARVREALPEILVPEWPEDKLLYPAALAALRCFDAPSVSREDAERTRLYAAEQRREAARTQVGSLDEWLASLGIEVTAELLAPAAFSRTTQLFNKTNQMNLSTRRLTEGELRDWASAEGHELWTITVRDRFGDAGLTGILGLARQGDVCRVEDFILSCRVMGRRVEETLAHLAVERARVIGAGRVEARYLRTAKNKPCLDFWASSGFEVDDTGERFTWNASSPYPRPRAVSLVVRG